MKKDAGQQHPISMYSQVPLLLSLLSSFSYLVDYLQFQGMLRWSLILVFMFAKAALIISIFMHVKWERLALKLVVFVPPIAIIILISLMLIEGDYINMNRLTSFIK